MFWCAVGAIGLLVLGALGLWLTDSVGEPAGFLPRLAPSLGFILFLAVPVIGLVGIVLSIIGLHRANRLRGHRRRLALAALVCNGAVALLGLPACWALLGLISDARSW